MMLPRYLKWPWISTRLGPTWIPGGGGSNHGRRWLVPLGGRCWGSDHHPNRLVIVD